MSRRAGVFVLIPLFLLLAAGIGMAGRETDKPRLVVAHDANYPPFSFLAENGSPQGYLIDLWKAFGRANTMAVEFRLGSWQQSLDMVRSGEADVHGGLFFSKRRDSFLDYGSTITDLSTYLYMLDSLTNEQAETCEIGVVQGAYEEDFMRREHPDRSLRTFSQNKAMIRAVSENVIKAFVADRPTGAYYLNRYGIRDDVIRSKKLYTKPLRVAVAEGRSALLARINLGLSKIPPKDVKYIRGKWFLPEYSSSGWLMPRLGIAVLVLVLAIALRYVIQRIHRPRV